MAKLAPRSLTECPICYEDYKTPKVTPCGHTFCIDCLKRHIGDKKVDFSCPVCCQRVEIPKGGVDKFITIFTLQSPTVSRSKSHISTDEPTFSNKEKQTIYKQTETSVTQKCPNHENRIVYHYCKTCNLGLCDKCIYVSHYDHETYDFENQDAKSKALGEISNRDQYVRSKIEGLEKYQASLQDACEKLQYFCDESCIKIESKSDKIIADLKSICEKTKKDIRKNFQNNDKKLTKFIAQNIEHIDDLKTGLRRELSTEDSTLDILQALHNLEDLEKKCHLVNIQIPEMTYLELKESDFMPYETILGSLHPKNLYIQGFDGTENNQCFRFNCNNMQYIDVKYYSNDKIRSNDVMWICAVVRWNDANFCVNIIPLEDDNPQIEFIDIRYKLIILNNNDEESVTYENDTKFKPGETGVFYTDIPWERLINVTEGFVNNDGEFSLNFEITQVKEIKMK